MSLGPLLLIIFDPATQFLDIHKSFLEIVMSEGRATLWWAAVVAALYSSEIWFSSTACIRNSLMAIYHNIRSAAF